MINFRQLCHNVDSLAKWLEHWSVPGRPRINYQSGPKNIFSYASYLFQLAVISSWELTQNWTLNEKMAYCHHFTVIINEDFLEEVECYGLITRILSRNGNLNGVIF